MSFDKQDSNKYPTYNSHDEVRCEECRHLISRKEKSYGFQDAPWMKVCFECKKCNWYNLTSRIEIEYNWDFSNSPLTGGFGGTF